MPKFGGQWRRFDWVLTISTLLLVAIGLVVLYGITLSQDQPDWGNLTRQLLAAGIGLAAAVIITLTDYQWLRTAARPIYIGGVVLALAVLIFGATIRGTTGWFRLGLASFQPVELIKIVVIVFLAWYLSRQPRPLNRLPVIITSGLGVLIFFVLTILQPDLGSALVLFLIWLGLFLIIGLQPYQWLLLMGTELVVATIAWFFLLAPYQQDRLRTFLDPAADPLGSGYNVTQSMIAIGSGGLTGAGLSFGSQSQLKFLPEAHTDFVFAVLAQEFGLLGVTLVLGLFAVLMTRLVRLSRRCRDDFALFLVLGVLVMIFVQLTMNVAMNLGLAPVTGVTLPLVSYGGSSLVILLASIGICQSVYARQ